MIRSLSLLTHAKRVSVPLILETGYNIKAYKIKENDMVKSHKQTVLHKFKDRYTIRNGSEKLEFED